MKSFLVMEDVMAQRGLRACERPEAAQGIGPVRRQTQPAFDGTDRLSRKETKSKDVWSHVAEAFCQVVVDRIASNLNRGHEVAST
jgi:hypothetical protein